VAYRTKPSAQTWRGRRLPGGCLSILTVLGMVAVMGAAVVLTPRVLPGLGIGATFVGGVAAVLCAAIYLAVLSRGEGFVARLFKLSGEVAFDQDELSLRVAGMGEQRLRFIVDDELQVRCASFVDDYDDERTYVILRRGDEVAICASSGLVDCQLRRLRVQEHPIDMPPDCVRLDLEHAALEEILLAVDEELEQAEA
jgi:hypothetical protein